MSPLNTLIKSLKIQNVGTAKHFPIFKISFNERNYVSVMRIFVYWLSQRQMNMLLFQRNKNHRIYVNSITNGVCQQCTKTFDSVFS